MNQHWKKLSLLPLSFVFVSKVLLENLDSFSKRSRQGFFSQSISVSWRKSIAKKKKPQEVYTRITYLHGITQVTGWSQVKWHKHNTAKLNQNITNCKLKTKANENLKVHSIPACWSKVNEMFGSQLLLYLQSGLYSCRFIRYNVEDNLCHLGFCVCIGLFSQCI